MRLVSKILLVFLLIVNFGYSFQKDKIEQEMDKIIRNATLILDNENLTKKEKRIEIEKTIDVAVDFKIMGKISLGKKVWVEITDIQREDFLKAFEIRIKQSYSDKINLYNKQKIKIVCLKPYKRTRLQLKTQIVGDEVYDINFNFYENRNNANWLIYDINIAGVSIIQTYKQQFIGILKEKTFNELLEMLKKQNKNCILADKVNNN